MVTATTAPPAAITISVRYQPRSHAAIAITAGMRVDELAHVPLSFPTYAGILGRVAASVTRQLNRQDFWQPN